jgi:carboxypeptidase Taq
MDAYAQLEGRFRRLSAIGGAQAMLEWDRSAMMPDGGADARAEQMATLSVLRHEILTAPDVGDHLAAAADAKLDDWQRANVREMRRLWQHATALPADLVEARERAIATSEMAWRTARRTNDFALLLPHLDIVLTLTREVAAAKGAAFGLQPYDALVQEYEPGASAARFDAIFADLAAFLPPFLERALAHQAAQPPLIPPAGPFPVAAQRDLGLAFMRALGFDFNHGRLDVSAHPFTGGVPDDVRLTTRYSEADFMGALMGVLHETGHALYELGLPARWRGQPVGEARGMVLHESQSLLVEMQACRSREFVAWAAPQLKAAFAGEGPAWEPQNLLRFYTRVRPGLIRVDADEVTYPLHVILRYRLERALLSGDLPLADLPGAWNAGMKELLGVDVPSDSDGCLQDIHWPGGSFGYFPTYTLGALSAAQLFAAARRADADIAPRIAHGDFAPLLAWLRTNVHGQGSLLETDDVLRRATGAPLGTDAFKAHLTARYLG